MLPSIFLHQLLSLDMAMNKKEKIHQACMDWLNNQLAELKAALASLKETIANEDKSSAGDKFETARAMAQKEMELVGIQLKKSLSDQQLMLSIDPKKKMEYVQLGSLIETDEVHLYIGVAIGRIKVDGKDVFIVSASSPIAQKILGQQKGFAFEMGAKRAEIKALN